MVMVSFSERCISALAEAIESYRLSPIEFESVQGKYERYLYARVVQNDFLAELYVYVDEAGCKLNKSDWKIFEKWDFSDDNELIAQFVAYVIRVLISGPGVKDDSRSWLKLSPNPQ